jgi:hypothetical protein
MKSLISWLSRLCAGLGMLVGARLVATTTETHEHGKPLDYSKLLRCIEAVEGNPWWRPGGRYGFTQGTWYDFSRQPYRNAQKPERAKEVALDVLLDTVRRLTNDQLQPSPYLLAMRWRWGYQGMIYRLHRHDDYATRVSNLYHDPSFR